ncbi:hypothetical protein CTI18_01945 [Prevotella intermedia]|uniref:Uncharacterized protein n=1 Tax=Prevotella intermedia TaxID=28131 RepID=A0A2G8I9K1_PREIN|nr:hypothetical protein CTI18_01945 [Prevotella intermedia]
MLIDFGANINKLLQFHQIIATFFCFFQREFNIRSTLHYEQKEDNKGVNIFQKHNYCIIRYTSACYKIYCFAFQKRLFYTVKA